MQVHLNNNANPVAPSGPPKPASRVASNSQTEETQFEASRALNGSLDQLPEIRPEVVERAKRLLQDSNYPPAEAIRKISSLLAMNLSESLKVDSRD